MLADYINIISVWLLSLRVVRRGLRLSVPSSKFSFRGELVSTAPPRKRSHTILILAVLLPTGCSRTAHESGPEPQASNPVAPTSASESASAARVPLPSSSQPVLASVAPSESVSPPSSASQDSEPLPEVKVVNIGMHIGGGPNDNETKEPIRASVQPHFDQFRRCWKLVDDPKKSGDVGVDLHIPRQGGKAKVSHPRTAIKGNGFIECAVGLFESIDYKKPKTGDTVVSYSLRFIPNK